MSIEKIIGAVIRDTDEGYALVDRDFVIRFSNHAYARHAGVSPSRLDGMKCSDVFSCTGASCSIDHRECPAKKAFETGSSAQVVFERFDPHGAPVYLEVKAYPVHESEGLGEYVLMTTRDVTEQKEMEKQLLHSQKMESIGTLAGGIAHYFKNVLTSISTFTDLIASGRELPLETIMYVKTIESAAKRAGEVISQLLDFSRWESPPGEPFFVNDVIADTLKMLSPLIPTGIDIRTSLADGLPQTGGSAGQIEQAIMNLMINARDAMPHGGTLDITTSLERVTARTLFGKAIAKTGDYVLIAVGDTGNGIEEKLLYRIFEPFFTTKAAGEGTGLGLAMAYRIVKRHHGYITAESHLGIGSVFKIYLPART